MTNHITTAIFRGKLIIIPFL
jgi:hypothetical protein